MGTKKNSAKQTEVLTHANEFNGFPTYEIERVETADRCTMVLPNGEKVPGWLIKENNRGWTFETYRFTSQPTRVFLPRGEWRKSYKE